jgi:hypothetical protein
MFNIKESIFSLTFMLALLGLAYPYLITGGRELMRLTSLYRAVATILLVLFALMIVLAPWIGERAQASAQLFGSCGLFCMAFDMRTLGLPRAPLAQQVRPLLLTLGAIGIVFAAAISLQPIAALITINLLLAAGYGWIAAEALSAWRKRQTANLLTICLCGFVGAVAMVVRADLIFISFSITEMHEATPAFTARSIASFALLLAALALSNEHLASLAQDERQRTTVLDGELFQILTQIAERRAGRTPLQTQRIVQCASLLARKLLKGRSPGRGAQSRLPEVLQQCAGAFDIGLTGIPTTANTSQADGQASFTQHPVIGESFFLALDRQRRGTPEGLPQRHQLLQTAAQIDGNYCEAWDGSGFPHGKAGRAIPLPARLVTAACAYATLLEEARKPGQRYAVNRIADALINQRGRKLDPDLVDLLIAYEPKFAALFDDTLHTMAA